MITADVASRLDKWVDSFDWRGALEAGEVTEEALVGQLEDLERRYPAAEEEGEN